MENTAREATEAIPEPGYQAGDRVTLVEHPGRVIPSADIGATITGEPIWYGPHGWGHKLEWDDGRWKGDTSYESELATAGPRTLPLPRFKKGDRVRYSDEYGGHDTARGLATVESLSYSSACGWGVWVSWEGNDGPPALIETDIQLADGSEPSWVDPWARAQERLANDRDWSDMWDELWELMALGSDDSLAKKAGHVSILFWDGEVVSTKSGELLWQRTLHRQYRGMKGCDISAMLPHQYRGEGNEKYMFTDYTAAEEIRAQLSRIADYADITDPEKYTLNRPPRS